MAMFEFSFDPSMYLKLMRHAQEEIFISLTEFDAMESGLNEIGITFTEDGEETEG